MYSSSVKSPEYMDEQNNQKNSVDSRYSSILSYHHKGKIKFFILKKAGETHTNTNTKAKIQE